MTGPAAVEIVLSEWGRGELEARVRRCKIAWADAMRAEIVLLAADGLNNCAIADEICASRMTILTWRKRFAPRSTVGYIRHLLMTILTGSWCSLRPVIFLISRGTP